AEPAARSATGRAGQQESEEALSCECGCGLTVRSSNHRNCGRGEPMKKEIAERIARGESRDEILAAFTTRYGEKVLSSPTFKGFNWLAWVTPFAVVLAAGPVLVVTIRRRVRTTTGAAPAPPGAASATDTALRARLARELADLDRE